MPVPSVTSMRILHTSDWHLGRGLHGVPLLDAQVTALLHLAEVAGQERADLVVVSGDVYDRALPGVEAVAALDEVLDAFLATGAQVLVTSGNHDSAQRLGFGRLRAARAGLHLRTGWEHATEPVLLADRDGPVACFGIGYLEPALCAPELGVARSHEAVLGAVTSRIRAAAGQYPRVVVAAHAFVAGGLPSDSERDIRVGGVDRASLTPFEGFTYTALGHLHAPQALTGRVRYSGSPLAYSFSEAGQTKGAWLVDVGPPGSPPEARFVPTPVPRPLSVLTGTLDDILTSPAHAGCEEHFCHVVLTDTERPRAPMERLRRRFPHTLLLTFAPEGAPVPQQPAPVVAGGGPAPSDEEVCLRFFQEVRGHGASAEERRLIWQALTDTRLEALS